MPVAAARQHPRVRVRLPTERRGSSRGGHRRATLQDRPVHRVRGRQVHPGRRVRQVRGHQVHRVRGRRARQVRGRQVHPGRRVRQVRGHPVHRVRGRPVHRVRGHLARLAHPAPPGPPGPWPPPPPGSWGAGPAWLTAGAPWPPGCGPGAALAAPAPTPNAAAPRAPAMVAPAISCFSFMVLHLSTWIFSGRLPPDVLNAK